MLRPEARALAGVPAEATSFAFVNPAAVTWSALTPGCDLSEPACLVALAGAFVYFDEHRQPCALAGALQFAF
eukprot:2297831-Prymnesium_polylepis.1